jgi:hypothetical protein
MSLAMTITAPAPPAPSTREIGGAFHLQAYPSADLHSWPVPHSFFGSGRAALHALCRRWMEKHPDVRLWMPEYFCPDVVSFLRSRIPLAFYPDDPQRDGPELSSLRVSPGDMVLAVNYFGVRSGARWSEWRESTPSAALIEDHTHDPQSLWARSSKADFAFASLRKTIPLPDGAIAWSPRALPLPAAAPDGTPLGSSLKLAAMLYKRLYLESGGTRPGLKRAFLDLQKRGEQMVAEPHEETISAWSLDRVCGGNPDSWRNRREHNVQLLLALAPHADGGKPLFVSWPDGHCPFNAVYVFADEAARDRVRNRLIAARVYTPVHWPLHGSDSASIRLSKRLLTIPVDFRCDDEQIRRIASLLGNPLLENPNAD